MDLEVYGLRVGLRGDWPEVLDSIRLDFAFFAADPPPRGDHGLELVIECRAPDFDSLGDGVASFVTPRNVVYQQDSRSVVDYFGRAVSIWDRDAQRLTVQGEEAHLVHEAAYQFLLSQIGQHLDRRALPRLHALGLSGERGAVAVMLPSGGGKSTLALSALRAPGVRLISEDTPLIDRRGRLHPFPLRIGVNAADALDFPQEHVRTIERMEFHPKVVLDLGAFEENIERSAQPLRHLVVGRRSLARAPRLEAMPRRSAAGHLLREGVVGVGVYQGMEFVLQHGMRDVAGMAGVGATRAACCGAGLARAKTWRLTLGRDHRANWDALSALLR